MNEIVQAQAQREITSRTNIPSKVSSQVDYILLDGSSSMQGKWWETLAAIDAYLSDLRTQHVDSHVVLNVFSGPHDLDMVQRNGALAGILPCTQDPIVSSVFIDTALYDGINLAVRALAKMDPQRAALIIATDGEENASKYTDQVQAKALLDWCRARGWQVAFIGVGFNNSATVRALGGDRADAVSTSTARLSDASRELARKRTAYARSGAPMHWSEEEQRQFGGYLGCAK
jgi:hypothetical protein